MGFKYAPKWAIEEYKKATEASDKNKDYNPSPNAEKLLLKRLTSHQLSDCVYGDVELDASVAFLYSSIAHLGAYLNPISISFKEARLEIKSKLVTLKSLKLSSASKSSQIRSFLNLTAWCRAVYLVLGQTRLISIT